MSKRNERSSNFELLRVLAMLLIVIFHITRHCVYVQLTDPASIERMNNGLFCNPVFYKRLLMIVSIMPLGKMGDTIFLLISGYFMIARTDGINLGKIARRLLISLIFANAALVVLSNLCYHLFSDTYIGMIGIGNVNSQSWFIGYYFVIIVAAALFLNSFLIRLSEKQFRTFLLTMLALFTFGWSGSLLNNLAETLRVGAAGIFVYSFGAYVRLYSPFRRVRSGMLILACILIYAFVCLSHFNTTVLNIEKYYLEGAEDIFYQSVYIYSDYGLVPITLGICVFELFRRLQIPCIRVINDLGSATLMIYLLHDNAFAYSLWNTQDWITLLYYNPIVFAVLLLVWGIGVFAAGVIIYEIFVSLGWLGKRFEQIAFRRV